jgi:hypothetical protein
MRLAHWLFHGLRNSWERLDATQRQAILAVRPGWEPPRPALDAQRQMLRDNLSGEDFLFMHRQMIAHVNQMLAEAADPLYPRVEGWPSVPRPGDPDYPVPAPIVGPDGQFIDAFIKSNNAYFQQFALWDFAFTDEAYLRSVSLGQLGADLEYSIHNAMHGRWAAQPAVGIRPGAALTEEIDPQWDDPAYDYLGDTYASHVNPIFWKLHGWVDDRIEAWKVANGIHGEIEWQGTWVGPMEHEPHPIHHFAPVAEAAEGLADMEQVAAILRLGAGFTGFVQPFEPAPSLAGVLVP